jgi:hypothetical protein
MTTTILNSQFSKSLGDGENVDPFEAFFLGRANRSTIRQQSGLILMVEVVTW